MKKTLLSILSLAAISNLSAQVTVTSADFPGIGDQVILVNDTMPSVTTGATGAGAMWDLTGIVQHTVDTNNFINPSTTTFASDFPTSTVALEGANQDTYFTNGASEATIDGMAGDPFGTGLLLALVFDDIETLLTFPSALGTSFTDTSHFEATIDAAPLGLPLNIDSIRINHTGYTTSTMDAEGSVTTPGGVFASARQYKVQQTEDFVEIYVSDLITAGALGITPNTWAAAPPVPGFFDANPTFDTTYTYTWYANGEGFPVAEIKTDLGGNTLSAQYLYKNSLLGFLQNAGEASCSAVCDGTGEVVAAGGIASAYSYIWPNGATTASATGLCSGSNAVTISDGNVSVVVMVEVTLAPAMTASINAFEHATCGTCADGSANASANGGTAPYTYLWNDAAPQTTAAATGLLPGSYSCTITDANGCSAVTTVIAVTGLSQEAINSMITIFPNPSNGVINIVTNDLTAGNYVIYNAIGEVVLAGTFNSTTEVIEISNLQNGLYFIDIQSDKGTIKKKITLVK
ncbi:MAG: T9SS type A sorting domain-containing protein [Flavobacteriales bacterium]|nr:T9SS type A sorting domain-containing protein [Flavobacteriales bacterium]